MIFTRRSIVVFLSWAIAAALLPEQASLLGLSGAKAQLLPPPQAAPTYLPPIPDASILPGVMPPAEVTPLLPDSAPAADLLRQAEKQAQDSFSVSTAMEILNGEVQRLDQATSSYFTVTLLRTDDQAFLQYVASGLLRQPVESYAATENGMYATLISGGQFNGVTKPICYVMIQPERAQGLWEQVVIPMSLVSHPNSGAAYLAGHEVGHCWDQYDRLTKMSAGRLAWSADQAKAVGLQYDAVVRVFGKQFSKDTLATQGNRLYSDPAQKQYQERVADAFGLLWMLKLGADPKALVIMAKDRDHMKPGGAHRTGPIIDILRKNPGGVLAVRRVEDIWDMARAAQGIVGIEPEALKYNEPTGITKDGARISHFQVTAKGLTPIDENGNEIVQPAVPLNKPKDFRSMPRFGSKPLQ